MVGDFLRLIGNHDNTNESKSSHLDILKNNEKPQKNGR